LKWYAIENNHFKNYFRESQCLDFPCRLELPRAKRATRWPAPCSSIGWAKSATAACGSGVGVSGQGCNGRMPHGQLDAKDRSLADLAAYVDAAVVFPDDAVAYRQAQSGALTYGFGGEERVEDAVW
jgi:hypothetical protein